MRPNSKVDLTGSRYYALSDRVKVLLLERLHGAPAPEEIPEPPLDLEVFQRATDIHFAAIRAKTGRIYYVNPYYIASWSNVFQERVYCSSSGVEEMFCPCSHEELKAFLMAIHPPQLRINAKRLSLHTCSCCYVGSSCHPTRQPWSAATSLHKVSYLIFLPCFIRVIFNRSSTSFVLVFFFVRLLSLPVTYFRCKANSTCTGVTWMCPQCKTYSSDANLLRNSTAPQR
uniref:BTB domain-containing protein n=1 Tax=Heterorhabditis bacteriophora TaxID=37862 RepID=A0A1I7XD04_HETBA